jgi:carbon monoxide dehydrogenase subunit G
MSTWTSHTTVTAAPCAVLDLLTDPDAIERWAPVPFEIEQLNGKRLDTGATARVSGKLARFGASFDVAVDCAHEERFALFASGPVDLDVEYELFADDRGTDVWVSVGVKSGGGLTGRLLTQATEALLRAGALDRALGRIAEEIEDSQFDGRTRNVAPLC